MLTDLFPIFFDTPADGGSGTAATDPAPAVDPAEPGDPAAPPADPAAPPAAASDPAEPAEPDPNAPVDWESRVTEWGGADEVVSAIELQQALRTPEGVRALFEEAGKAVGIGSDKLAELLGQPAAEAPADPFAAILGDDPDRVMTAGEVAEALKQVLQEQVLQPQAERDRQVFEDTVRRNATAAFTSVLGENYDEQLAVTLEPLADRYLQSDADLASPQKVLEAVRRAKADFDAIVAKQHAEYVGQKKGAHENLPTPLVGTSPAGEDPAEPQSVSEASKRAHARIAAAIASGTT